MNEENIDFSMVFTLAPDFMQHWSGNRLFEYYDSRVLTEDQMRGLIESERTKAEAVTEEERQAFLESGALDEPPPWYEKFDKAMDKLYPGTSFPYKDAHKKITKAYNKKHTDKKHQITFDGVYVSVDGTPTSLLISEISSLWTNLLKFNTESKAWKLFTKMVVKKLR